MPCPPPLTQLQARELQAAKDVQFESQHSRVSGTLYLAGEDHLRLLSDAYGMFAHTNPMHSDVFPSVRRMESEVVNMTASLLGKGGSAHLLPETMLSKPGVSFVELRLLCVLSGSMLSSCTPAPRHWCCIHAPGNEWTAHARTVSSMSWGQVDLRVRPLGVSVFTWLP